MTWEFLGNIGDFASCSFVLDQRGLLSAQELRHYNYQFYLPAKEAGYCQTRLHISQPRRNLSTPYSQAGFDQLMAAWTCRLKYFDRKVSSIPCPHLRTSDCRRLSRDKIAPIVLFQFPSEQSPQGMTQSCVIPRRGFRPSNFIPTASHHQTHLPSKAAPQLPPLS